MVKKKLLALASVLLIFIAGCNLYQFETTDAIAPDVTISDIETDIINSLKQATREDCIDAYVFFSGFAAYLERSSKIETTPQIFNLLNEVENDYGWAKEKYPALTDVIEKDLKSKGMEEPKPISDKKDELISIFKGYAEACKKTAEQKGH